MASKTAPSWLDDIIKSSSGIQSQATTAVGNQFNPQPQPNKVGYKWDPDRQEWVRALGPTAFDTYGNYEEILRRSGKEKELSAGLDQWNADRVAGVFGAIDPAAFTTTGGAPSWAKQQGYEAEQGVYDPSRYRQAYQDRAAPSQGLQDLYARAKGQVPSYAMEQALQEAQAMRSGLQSQVYSQRGGYNPSLDAISRYAGGVGTAQATQGGAIAQDAERDAAQQAYLQALSSQRGQDIEFEKQMNAQRLAAEQAKQNYYGMGVSDKFQVANSQAAYQKAMADRDTNIYKIVSGQSGAQSKLDAQKYAQNMQMYGNIASGALGAGSAIAGSLVKKQQQNQANRDASSSIGKVDDLKKPYGW